jgi:DNA mismatch repair ATPase MutS
MQIVDYLAEIDCLCSLASFALDHAGKMCKPELIQATGRSILDLRQMRHPCVNLTFKAGEVA